MFFFLVPDQAQVLPSPAFPMGDLRRRAEFCQKRLVESPIRSTSQPARNLTSPSSRRPHRSSWSVKEGEISARAGEGLEGMFEF